MTTEKVYTMDSPSNMNLLAELINAKNQGTDAATMSALFSRNNDGGQWNNPFMYLIWLTLLGRGGLFGSDGQNTDSKLNELSAQMANNQNTNLMMDAINGNHEALHTISSTLGVSFANMQGAVAQVQNAITQVGGQVGMTGQQVINSVLLGNKDLTAALQTCCCENKQLVQQMGYEGQIRDLQNASALTSRIDQLANGITQGFSATSYAAQQHANDIIQAGNANTQRIVDTLNNHWQSELSQKYADAKLELSQLNQNATLIAALKTT